MVNTVHPKKYADGLCLVLFRCVWYWSINAYILWDYFNGTGAIIRLPQCLWNHPEEYDLNEIHEFNRVLQYDEPETKIKQSNTLNISYEMYCTEPHRSILIPTWISNYIHYYVWDEITYPFPNFNGCTVEVWERISNFIPHFTGHVITYPCCDSI